MIDTTDDNYSIECNNDGVLNVKSHNKKQPATHYDTCDHCKTGLKYVKKYTDWQCLDCGAYNNRNHPCNAA